MTDRKYINVASIDDLAEKGIKQIAVAIGVFDGVHTGHQLLIKKLVEMAKDLKAVPVAMTFHPHPREILRPDSPPVLLIPPEKKVELLHKYGAEAVVTVPFTKELSLMSGQGFMDKYLLGSNVRLCGICVGSKWKFGAGASSGVDFLKKTAYEKGFRFEGVGELIIDGKPVSSTQIRKAISGGRLDEAQKMLGRHYSLSGEVESGHRIAGEKLECPTANLKITYGVIPPNGVYAGMAMYEGKKYPAALAVGVSPTLTPLSERHQRIEAHLIDFHGDIYGRHLEVEFFRYMREERCFSSVEELKNQIKEDVKHIKSLMGTAK